MRKKTRSALLVVIIVALGIAGGWHYWNLQQQAPSETAQQEFIPEGNLAPPAPEPEPEPERTDKVLTCKAPDGSIFYTYAPRCDEADLDNRVATYDPSLSRSLDRPKASRKLVPANSYGESAEGNIALQGYGAAANDVPQGCKWEWGRALEVERMLAKADDPNESGRKDSYCERLCEVRAKGCQPSGRDFKFMQICNDITGGCTEKQ